MADIVSPEKRSQMMASIKGKNTKPEIAIRKALHRMGFRYKLHDKTLPGTPDLVFPKYKAVLFIHGCFWHGHNCNLFKLPSTRPDFWMDKITRNQYVDQKNISDLNYRNWRTATIWECSIRKNAKYDVSEVIKIFTQWLVSDKKIFEIRG